jgi:hypothetical protein
VLTLESVYTVTWIFGKMELPLDQQPAMPPPPGFKTNFVDPPSQQPAIIAMSAVFISLMLLAVSVRAYTRTLILKSWGWDDSKSLHSYRVAKLIFYSNVHSCSRE